MDLDTYIINLWHIQQTLPFNYYALTFKLLIMAILLFYLFYSFKGFQNEIK